MIKFLLFVLLLAGLGYGAYWYFFKADQRLLDQAREAVSKGDYTSALNDIEQLVSKHPQSDKLTRAEELRQEAGKKLRDQINIQIDKLIAQDKVDSAKVLVKTVREKLGYLADNLRYAGDMDMKIAVANAETAFQEAETRANAGDHAAAKQLLMSIVERHGQTEFGRRAADWLKNYRIRYQLRIDGVNAPDGVKFDPVIINSRAAAPDFYVVAELNGARLFMTDIVKDSAVPRWTRGQEVVLHEADVLTFKIYDDDGLRGNELVATTQSRPGDMNGKMTVSSKYGPVELMARLENGPAVR